MGTWTLRVEGARELASAHRHCGRPGWRYVPAAPPLSWSLRALQGDLWELWGRLGLGTAPFLDA